MCVCEGSSWGRKHSLVMSYTTTATVESRMYEGMRLRNLSCPAVSHNCRRTWSDIIIHIRIDDVIGNNSWTEVWLMNEGGVRGRECVCVC